MIHFTIVKQDNHMKKWDNLKTEELIEAVLALKGKKEAKAFLRDLMTEKEIFEFGNRWRAAKMLAERMSYSKIQKETGLSTRTIARISKWLKKGKGGYQSMLKKISMHHHVSSCNRKKF